MQQFQALIDALPSLGSTPPGRDWTAVGRDAIRDVLATRPLGVLEQQQKARISQMSEGGGDDDAWTWTPPSR